MTGAEAIDSLCAVFADQVARRDQGVVVSEKVLAGVFAYLRRDIDPCYDILVDLTAVDHLEGHRTGRFAVHYCLRSGATGQFLRLEVICSGLSLPSAMGEWPVANWFEREVFDLMGIDFGGHIDLRRILLPVDFVEHPLRKDYPLAGMGERCEPGTQNVPQPSSLAPVSAEGEVVQIDLNPLYPGQGVRMLLDLEGERVRKATPDPGYVHAGLEKLGESLTYRQCTQLTGRLGEQLSFSGEMALALAVENLLQLQVPPRARYLRVVWCELGRIMAHLAWLAEQARLAGSSTAWHTALTERDKIRLMFEALGLGAEVGLICIGGTVLDLEAAFAASAVEFCTTVPNFIDDIDRLFTGHPFWLRRVRGLGELGAEAAIGWGASGPVLRAAGVARDIRRDDPYSQYEDFDFSLAVGERGDVYDRCQVRLAEVAASARIIEQALGGMPEGAHRVADRELVGGTPTTPEGMIHHFSAWMDGHGLQPPPGDVYLSVEAPGGELGVYLVSDGTDRPYRLRFRTPSFAHLQCYPHLVSGLDLDEAALVLGSLNIVAAEVDR